MQPERRYARSGDVHIAYQVVGQGSIDLVQTRGAVSHLEYDWEEPSFARYLTRLTSSFRVILFDKPGTGLSERVTDAVTLEQRTDDILAVMGDGFSRALRRSRPGNPLRLGGQRGDPSTRHRRPGRPAHRRD